MAGLIPSELILNIFEFVTDYRDVISCSCVCKLWYQTAQEQQLWRQLCQQNWEIWNDIERDHEQNDWKNTFIRRITQDRLVPGLIKGLILHTTRKEARKMLISFGDEIIEFLTVWINNLRADQPDRYFTNHLAILYRAEPILNSIKARYNCKKWRQLMSIPMSERSVLDGAILLSEWGTSQNGDIVREKLSYLAQIFVHEVGGRAELERMIENHQQINILEQLMYFLYEKQQIRGPSNAEDYYNPSNSFLHHVLEYKRGIPITLCICFKAITDQLNINVDLLSMPQHFMLVYRPTLDVPKCLDNTNTNAKPKKNKQIAGDEIFIDCFNGKLMNLQECCAFFSEFTLQKLPISHDYQTWYRMLYNLRQIFKSEVDERIVYVLSALIEISPTADSYLLRCIVFKENRLSDEAREDLAKLKASGEYEEAIINRLEAYIIESEQNDNIVQVPKLRSQANRPIQYQVGHVFKHKLYGYKGVIVRWDSRCKASDAWKTQMNVHSLSRGALQPFYFTMVGNGADGADPTTYVAEENVGETVTVPLNCANLGKFFDRYDQVTHKYIPNDETRQLFPEG